MNYCTEGPATGAGEAWTGIETVTEPATAEP